MSHYIPRFHRLSGAIFLTTNIVVIPAYAFDFDVGNSDVRVRWDNTFKWSGAYRLEDQQASLIASPNHDDGDRNFDKGLVSNRLDLLSEFDVTYQRRLGMRVSAAALYDTMYNRSNDNPGFAGGSFPNHSSTAADHFTDDTRDIHGRRAEVLDAFLFGKTELGDTTVSARLGRHAILWGESLFYGANAIAGGQMPVDIVKIASVPNTQFKEAVRPVEQISGSWELTPEVSISAYYQFKWDASLAPAVGSYFSNSDVAIEGAESMLLGPMLPAAPRLSDKSAKDSGQGGVQLRVRAGETEFGFYAIRFHSKTPQIVPVLGIVGVPPMMGVAPVAYRQEYQENVKAFGVSANRSFGDFNVGIEGSIREDQDLASTQGADATLLGGTWQGYATGRTAHVNVSTIASLSPGLLWNEAQLAGEIAWNRVLSVTDNKQALDPNATRDALALRIQLEPFYRQVLPGLDISVPLSLSYAPRGSRSMALGPNATPAENGGDLSLGVNGTYLDAWRMSLSYTHFYGSSDPFQSANNAYTYKQTLADRDYVAFSLRRTF